MKKMLTFEFESELVVSPIHSPIIMKENDYECDEKSVTPPNIKHLESQGNRDSVIAPVIKTQQRDASPEMCRRFVQQTCTRGYACKFDHNINLNQLKSVYRFCWDYQNGKCFRKICYYVHATVFEVQGFFKTGQLPPHVMHSIRLNKEAVRELLHLRRRQMYSTHTPKPTEVPATTAPQYTRWPHSVQESTAQRGQYDVSGYNRNEQRFSIPPETNVLPKRNWRDANVSSSASDPQTSEPLAKKCKKCNPNEFRLICNYNEQSEMLKKSAELKSQN